MILQIGKTKKNSNRGSLIIEAILATSIISITLTVLIQSIIGNYRSLVFQRDYVQAISILEDHLSRLSIDPNDTLAKSVNPKFKYSQNLSKIDDNLNKASLTVQWSTGQKQRSLSISTMIFRNENT